VRILGIDPGSLFTGYGVVDYDGQRLGHVASGCIRVAGSDFSVRLREIFRGVGAVLAEFTPEELAVESLCAQECRQRPEFGSGASRCYLCHA